MQSGAGQGSSPAELPSGGPAGAERPTCPAAGACAALLYRFSL